jgi:hypothetical protein
LTAKTSDEDGGKRPNLHEPDASSPDILGQAILDEILVLIFIKAHVNHDIPNRWPSFEEEHHVF